jgi:hypothetical protein
LPYLNPVVFGYLINCDDDSVTKLAVSADGNRKLTYIRAFQALNGSKTVIHIADIPMSEYF